MPSFKIIGLLVQEKKIFNLEEEENCGHIHVFSPGAGEDNPLGSKLYHKHKSPVNLVICCKFKPLNGFVTVFPIQIHRQPSLTLAVKLAKVNIYRNVVELQYHI